MQEPGMVLARLATAAALGAVVGVERERAEQAAGLRTHALVSLGAALFMLVSQYGFAGVLGADAKVDPSRVAAQVASGVGFLGAGTIILRRQIVRGLTTAASIWCVAAIGLASGGGLYVAATATTVFVLVVLALMHRLEGLLFGWRQSTSIVVVAEAGRFPEEAVRRAVSESGATLVSMELRFDNTKKRDRAVLRLRGARAEPGEIADAIRRLPGIRAVRAVIEGRLLEGRSLSPTK